jgi:uncharacterized protein YhfF
MQPETLWNYYLDTLPAGHPHRAASFTAWAFGDSPELAQELADLVVAGTKTATASLAQAYEIDNEPMPKPGDLSIILDGDNEPVCIIETTEIRVLRFGDVDPQFAYDEGEGDRSLAYWRDAHTRFFTRACREYNCTVDDDLPVVCERFRVIYRRER